MTQKLWAMRRYLTTVVIHKGGIQQNKTIFKKEFLQQKYGSEFYKYFLQLNYAKYSRFFVLMITFSTLILFICKFEHIINVLKI